MSLVRSKAAGRVLLGMAALAISCPAAPANTATLVCNISSSNAAGLGTIELNEGGGSITIHWPPFYDSNRIVHENTVTTYAAKFDPKAITFVGPQTMTSGGIGEKITINRLTGVFIENGNTWTCQVGKSQF